MTTKLVRTLYPQTSKIAGPEVIVGTPLSTNGCQGCGEGSGSGLCGDCTEGA